MGKSSPSPPPAPDPSAVAAAQGQANTQTAETQQLLNFVNQASPMGTINYNQTGVNFVGPGGIIPGPSGTAAAPAAGGSPAPASPTAPAGNWVQEQNPDTGGWGFINTATGQWSETIPQQPAASPAPAAAPAASPSGGIDFSKVSPPSGYQSIPQYTQTYTPSPGEAAIQQGQLAVGQQLTNLAGTATNAAQGILGTPFSLPTTPQIQTGVNTPGATYTSLGLNGAQPGGTLGISTLGNGQYSQVNPSQVASVQGLGQVNPNQVSSVAQLGQLAPGTVMQPGSVNPSQFQAQGNQAAQAAYNAQLAMLQPQLQWQSDQLQNQLVSQGFNPTDAAYTKAMNQMDLSNNATLSNLANQSVLTGDTEQQNLFNMALSGQNQSYTQGLGAAQLGLGAQSQGYGEGLSSAQLGLGAQNQGFGQGLSSAQLGLGAQNQQFSQNLGAQGQQFNQNLGAQNQQFNQALANAQLSNTAQQQEVQQALIQQNQPINEISALLNGGQIQLPGFQPYNQTQVAPTDVVGSYNMAANAAQNNYAAQAQLYGANMGALGGLAGNAGLAAVMLSDRRLKKNIRRIGTAFNGLPIYLFNYTNDNLPGVGFMADEVETVNPDAVVTLPSGFKAVDYNLAAA